MLTENQEKYLEKIPESKIAKIKPWDPRTKEIAEDLIAKIRSTEPALSVLWMGASALRIAGQNDIDMYICASEKDFQKYLSSLENIFGKPVSGISIIKWKLQINGFDVELYLTDPGTPSMREQIKVFEILKSDPALREAYERLKLRVNGLSFREYMRRKYEFFNELLKGNM